MDFHALPRRDLQALCKRNSIRANMTNVAMADALTALPAVDGIEEYVKQPAAEPTPAANPAAKYVAEEWKQGIPLQGGRRVTFKLPDEHKDTAPALGLGRCAMAEPVVAPGKRRRAAASKTEAGDVASEAAPVLATKRRAVESNSKAEDVASEAVPVPATRRRAAANKSEAAAEAVPMATRRRTAASKTETGDVATEAVPAPTTRERRQRTVTLVAKENVPRARRTARRAPVTKTDIQHEEEGEGMQGVVSDVRTTAPAPVSDEGHDGPDNMEEAMNPENEERNEVVEELNQEEEEISRAPMETVTPVEEKPPLAEDCTDNSSVQEPQVDVEQCEDLQIVLGLVGQEECAGSGEGPLDEDMIHHSSEEAEIVPVKEEAEIVPVKEEAQDTLKSVEATENVSEVPTSGEELHSAAKAKEAGTEDGFLLEEKEGLAADAVLHDTDVAVEEEGVVAVDAVLHDTDVAVEEEGVVAIDAVLHDTHVAVEEEGVVATDNMPQSSATVNVDVDQEVFTVDDPSQVTATDVEGTGVESAFTGDLPPVFDTARDCIDDGTSPFFAGMFEDVTISVSMDSVSVETKVSEEASDVSPCMHSNSNGKNITEAVAVEQEKEVKEGNKSEAMGNLSLRKLRVKFKETVAVGQENEVMEGKKSMGSVTVEPKVSEEAGDVSLCMYNNSNENNITKSVAAEQEEEVKESNKSDAMGNLSLRKLRVKFKETVAVGQENEVKEGKKSMALDKLSLRKLKIKLKETLIAHKSREPNRAPLGRLDENVC